MAAPKAARKIRQQCQYRHVDGSTIKHNHILGLYADSPEIKAWIRPKCMFIPSSSGKEHKYNAILINLYRIIFLMVVGRRDSGQPNLRHC